MFHSLPVEARDGYLRSIHRAAAPGATLFILVFAVGAFPPESETKSNEVTEDELREAVSRHWTIDEIRPAFIHAHMPQFPGLPEQLFTAELDDKGRRKMPAFLLTAHKAS